VAPPFRGGPNPARQPRCRWYPPQIFDPFVLSPHSRSWEVVEKLSCCNANLCSISSVNLPPPPSSRKSSFEPKPGEETNMTQRRTKLRTPELPSPPPTNTAALNPKKFVTTRFTATRFCIQVCFAGIRVLTIS